MACFLFFDTLFNFLVISYQPGNELTTSGTVTVMIRCACACACVFVLGLAGILIVHWMMRSYNCNIIENDFSGLLPLLLFFILLL